LLDFRRQGTIALPESLGGAMGHDLKGSQVGAAALTQVGQRLIG
jgi:hypothetical protein